MRLFTILLMSVCALISSIGTMADDVLSTLIGDDKVWNYHTNIYDQDKPVDDYDSYSVYCDGTVEKFGKEYAVVIYQNGEKKERLAYIREEAGKLFISSDSPVFEWSTGYGNGYIDPDFADLKEFPVFDFNAKEGDTFQGLVNHFDGFRVGEIEVKRVYTITVNDRAVRVFDVVLKSIREWNGEPDIYEVGEQTVVEGIGYLTDWFFLPFVGDFTTSLYGPSVVSWFKSLTDKKGNLIIKESEIFPSSSSSTFPSPDGYAHFFRKDRTWVYSFVRDGVEQTKSLHFGERIVKKGYGYYYPVIDENGETVAHMAYDFYTKFFDHPIASRFAHDKKELSDIYESSGTARTDELIIYNFYTNMPEYETFVLAGGNGEYRKAKVTVESMETVEIAGEKCRREIVKVSGRPNEKFVVIEGIGANTGWLYEPAWGNPQAYEVNGLATLKEVLDGDGNVIFRYEDFGPTNAVEDVLDDAANRENDTRKFDLFGREIRDPQPGTIYVQGGRKFVAR